MHELRIAFNAAVVALRAAAEACENPAEGADLDALRTAFDEVEAEAKRTKANLDAAEHRASAVGMFVEVDVPAPAQREALGARVEVHEPATYRRDNSTQVSFFGDMYAAQFQGDRAAAERQTRNAREMADLAPSQRAAGTSAFSGLVVPQYLVDLYAPMARAGRPFADTCRHLPLPAEGMVFNISRLTTGSTTASQDTENTAVSSTDVDDTLLPVSVNTISGQQDVSRQLMERGTPGMDELIFQDLLLDYATKLDAKYLAAMLATANINAVTYTSASPTVAEIYPKLSDALQQVASKRYLPADTFLCHPRRWGWFTAALDAHSRPLVVPVAGAPFAEASDAAGLGSAAAYGRNVGILQGQPVTSDANIATNLGTGTNQDVMVAYRAADLLLWEEGDGTPRTARFEQTLGGNLTTKLVLYGYSAFTAGRYPAAISTISGTGLVVPTF
jgi:HK97 family phage major capsid protein